MAIIGVRELREEATRILQRVREEKAEYIITYQGRPIALLLPLDADRMEAMMMEAGKRALAGGWAAYARLANELRQAWPQDRSAQSALDEVRR